MAAVKKKKKKREEDRKNVVFYTGRGCSWDTTMHYYCESGLIVNRDRKGIIMKQKDEWLKNSLKVC